MATNLTTNIYGNQVKLSSKKAPISIETKTVGLKFPIGSHLAGGFFAKESGVDLVKSNLKQLLLTERGERVMLPKFGANLRRFIFEPLDQRTFNEIKEEILFSINNYLPTVRILKLQVFSGDDINYQGTQGIIIKLLARLEPNDEIIDTTVRIG